MTSLPPIEEHLVEELRRRVVPAIEETGLENFHPADVERVKSDDYWMWRFIMHQRRDIGWAFDMVMECLKWRKEFGVNDIKASEFPQFLDDIGAMYVCNKDREGHRVVIMHVRRYRKEPIIAKMIRRYFIHYMEKLEKEDPFHRVSIIFDMQGAGLSNVDMDFLFFMFSCFKTYYPSGVAYIYAFDMPWIFSAMWKVVKSWLSAGAANKIKFVNKKTIVEFIDPEELLVEFGGNIPISINQVEAEKLSEKLKRMSSADAAIYILSSEKLPITIEEMKMTSTPKSNIRHVENEEFTSPMAADCLNVSPSLVHFFNGSAVVNISNFNSANVVLAYKVRTTSPEKFRVRPNQGLIRCGSTVKVAFTLLPGYHIDSEDKFIILGMDMGHERRAIVDHVEMSELWKLCPKQNQVEHKLNCVVKRHKSLLTNVEEKGVILISTTEILLNDTTRLRKEVYSVRKTMHFMIIIQFLLVVALLHYQFAFVKNSHFY